jgi:hypothetical protein
MDWLRARFSKRYKLADQAEVELECSEEGACSSPILEESVWMTSHNGAAVRKARDEIRRRAVHFADVLEATAAERAAREAEDAAWRARMRLAAARMRLAAALMMMGK